MLQPGYRDTVKVGCFETIAVPCSLTQERRLPAGSAVARKTAYFICCDVHTHFTGLAGKKLTSMDSGRRANKI